MLFEGPDSNPFVLVRTLSAPRDWCNWGSWWKYIDGTAGDNQDDKNGKYNDDVNDIDSAPIMVSCGNVWQRFIDTLTGCYIFLAAGNNFSFGPFCTLLLLFLCVFTTVLLIDFRFVFLLLLFIKPLLLFGNTVEVVFLVTRTTE